MRDAITVHVEHEAKRRRARERRELDARLIELGDARAKGDAR